MGDAQQEMMKTESICPVCLEKIVAEYCVENKKVFLKKSCPRHGMFKTLIWEDADHFDGLGSTHSGEIANTQQKAQKGCPYDCGLCEKHEQAACCVLIEITQRCDQYCPFCFAMSEKEAEREDYSPEDMQRILRFLAAQNPGSKYNLQLSGGEPSLHPNFFEIVRLCKQEGFPYVQVNTNGKKLAQSLAFAQNMKSAGVDCVFLQFDGMEDEIYKTLRGQALFAQKERALEHCRKANLPVVLAVTVVPNVNENCLGDMIRYAAKQLPHVRGVHFQPVSYFGRYPNLGAENPRLTLPGLIEKIEWQTAGEMGKRDFVPLQTGHERCSIHGNFLFENNHFIGCSEALEGDVHSIEKARKYLARKWGTACCKKAPAPQIEQGAAEGDAYDVAQWKEWLHTLNRNILSITAMAFQDAYNLDLKRLKKCRLHVATKDCKLIPFCAYNITSEDGKTLYR